MGNLWKGTVSAEFRANRPKLYRNSMFLQNIHSKKLGAISVFYAMLIILSYYYKTDSYLLISLLYYILIFRYYFVCIEYFPVSHFLPVCLFQEPSGKWNSSKIWETRKILPILLQYCNVLLNIRVCTNGCADFNYFLR